MVYTDIELNLVSLTPFNYIFLTLKMPCLYLDNLIIGHKHCNVLSILNILIWQKKLNIFVTNNEFWQKSKPTTKTTIIIIITTTTTTTTTQNKT